MNLSVEQDLLLSYACHINSYKDIELIKHNLLIISRKCKIIGIAYSLNHNLNKNIIENQFKSLQQNIIKIKLCNEVENKGYDFRKHLYNIQKIQKNNLHNNEYILMMNDSVITINANTFDKSMHNLELLINDKYEFIGFLESNEIKKHYQSWFWCADKNTINWILIQIENILCSCSEDKNDFILIEVNLSNYLIKNNKSGVLYNFDIERNLFYHHPDIYLKALYNGFPFLKKNYFSDHFHNAYRKWDIFNYLPINISKNLFPSIKR